MTKNTLGFVFPGQGSQSVGMLADIAREYSEVEHTFNEASVALDYDLWKLVQVGPAEELDKTARTQPALLAASYALWKIITTRKDIRPAFIAGHSLGEYTALVCAEAISFFDAIKLVAARGEFMQAAVPVGLGALAAIVALDDETVLSICKKAADPDEVLSPANFNSIGQVVIAGHTEAVLRAIVLAKEAGARIAKMLPVSAPSHCLLMKPAAERLSDLLESLTIKTPKISIVNNVDVSVYRTADEIRSGLVRQLFMPVRWVEVVRALHAAGVTRVIECGPGKVLSGLNKRIVPEMEIVNTVDLSSLQMLLENKAEIK